VPNPPIFFDFFGTLVDYPADQREDLTRTHALLAGWGCPLGYDTFRADWLATFARLDDQSIDHREYHMRDVATAFLSGALGRPPRAGQVAEYLDCYLAEWCRAVHLPAGVPDLVRSLAAGHTLAVVTNTHMETLVPDLLAAAGLADSFTAVVTSVAVGWRKPHPAIYAAACRQLGVAPETVVFVGDTYEADYAGPTRAAMTAFLIDPAGRAPVPPARRLRSVLDLPARLAGL
jgi:putative hydrolase of the HAD superfamily